MATRKKSAAVSFLEGIAGGPLTLGRLIYAIRIGEKMSQVGFAEKLGISKSHLCDIEKDRKPISPVRAAGFAKRLGYSEVQFVQLAVQDSMKRAGLSYKVHIEAA